MSPKCHYHIYIRFSSDMYVIQLEAALMPGMKYITQKERSTFPRLFLSSAMFYWKMML